MKKKQTCIYIHTYVYNNLLKTRPSKRICHAQNIISCTREEKEESRTIMNLNDERKLKDKS